MSDNAVVKSNDSSGMLAIIKKNSLWLKISAVLYMIYGVLMTITVIGALLGVPMAWAGWRLWKSVDEANTGKGEDSVANICFYFKVNGIIFLIGLVLGLLQVVFLGAMFGGMLAS